MNISISVTGGVPRRLIDKVTGPMSRRSLHEAMGVEVQVLTANYLRALAATRHDTAEALGATPTGHLALAAEKVASSAALSADETAATLVIDHPGMGRAFHDVTIRPREAKMLAIPVHAIAYGNRARLLWQTLNLFIPKGCNFIAMKMPDGKSILKLYILVRSVTQKQDRSLLPSNQEWEEAAGLGARKWFANEMGQGAPA